MHSDFFSPSKWMSHKPKDNIDTIKDFLFGIFILIMIFVVFSIPVVIGILIGHLLI